MVVLLGAEITLPTARARPRHSDSRASIAVLDLQPVVARVAGLPMMKELVEPTETALEEQEKKEQAQESRLQDVPRPTVHDTDSFRLEPTVKQPLTSFFLLFSARALRNLPFSEIRG